MVIHDDFWAAAKAMPERQRAPFLYALMAYRFEGVEPKGSPPWLPTFLVIKDRLELGDKSSQRGRDMANARWEKHRAQQAAQDAAASAEQDAQAYAQADAQAYAAARNCRDAEVEDELGVGEPPYSPPMPGDLGDAPFWLQCLAALNDALGAAYTTMPGKCRRMLERSAAAVTVEQVRSMVEFKRDEWGGTRWRKCLTPNTLFSPDHFEQYLHQSQDADGKGGGGGAELGEYAGVL